MTITDPSRIARAQATNRYQTIGALLSDGLACVGRHPLAAIACIGFSLRCIWWMTHPVLNSPDAIVYLKEADNLFSAGRIESNIYMPLYPILIHLAGANGIILLQIVLSTASIYLAHQIAGAVWPSQSAGFKSAGLVAATMMAVHPMLIYYATFRLTETVFIFLVLVGFAALYRDRIAGAALAFTLANLVRPSLDLLFPAILVAGTFATVAKPTLRELARRLSIYALIYATLMSAWWLHNYEKYHRFVRLNLGAGIIMILENNEQFEQYGLDFSKLTPWVPFAGITDPVEQDAAMQAAGINYIKTRPLAWLRGDLDRVRRFFTPSDLNFSRFQRYFSALVVTAMVAGALASLALVAGWRRRLPLWLPIVFLSALHLSFHALPRYRLPLDPLLIVLASGSIAAWQQRERKRSGLIVGRISEEAGQALPSLEA